MDLDLRLVRAFVTVADKASFSAAARDLHETVVLGGPQQVVPVLSGDEGGQVRVHGGSREEGARRAR